MKKASVALIMLLVGVILSGCVGDTITGKYVYEKDNRFSYVLYSDGQFYDFRPGGSASGTYRVADNEVLLTYAPFGNVEKLKIETENNSIVDKDGNRYIKTKTER